MMYYIYLAASFVGDLFVTLENRLVESLHDIWRPVMLFPLLFSCCIVIHAISISIMSLFAGKYKDGKNMNNFFRKVTLESIDLFLHIMRARIHIDGEEIVPKDKKFMLIGNHLSIFDPMISMLMFSQNDLGFISKKENISIPFGGRLMLASGCISLDRRNNRSAVGTTKEAASRISDGIESVGIYPEGGINKTDEVLLPFHSGSFKIAKESGSPIVVMTVRNTEKLCRRFLFAATDVYIDIIRVVQPYEYESMKTKDISNMVWSDMYEHLCTKYYTDTEIENEPESQQAAC